MKIIAQTAGGAYLCELTHKEVKLLNPDRGYLVKLGDEFDISLATQTLEKIRRFRSVDLRRTDSAVEALVKAQQDLSAAYSTLLLLDDIKDSENLENEKY